MMYPPPPPRTRAAGFTLIELLVVIAIIAVLAALTTAGVMRAMRRGPEVDNMATLRQLTAGCTNFKSKFGVYPPSRIYISNALTGPNSYATSTLGTPAFRQASLAFLKRLWPRLAIPNTATPTTFDWSGGKVGFTGEAILEGDQCLVFFLGGIPNGVSPTTPGCLGFSTNPANPTVVTGDRVSFFEFKNNRLYERTGNGFYSYKDSHSEGALTPQPYAYFWSGSGPGLTGAAPNPLFPSLSGRQNSYFTATSDCASLGVSPYFENPAPVAPATTPPQRFLNKDTFQIISAGYDNKFGTCPPMGWNKTSPALGDGADDISNFNDTLLSAP